MRWPAAALAVSLCGAALATPKDQPTPTSSRTPAAGDPFASALTDGHPWPYEFSVEPRESSRVWSFRSVRPYKSKNGPAVHLRFEVSRQDFPSAVAASQAFDDLTANADPDTGLSYAWDAVLLDGARLWHLAAPCLYSRANFARLTSNLASAAMEQRVPDRAMRCRCGGGCRVEPR